MMPTTYTSPELKEIGSQCSARLPPASAVQAMFLYEMQRDTDAEKLFRARMFELARARDETQTQASEIRDLREQVAALQKQLKAREVDERLATSKVRMDAFQTKLASCLSTLEEQQSRLGALATELRITNASGHALTEQHLPLQHGDGDGDDSDGNPDCSLLTRDRNLRSSISDICARMSIDRPGGRTRGDVASMAKVLQSWSPAEQASVALLATERVLSPEIQAIDELLEDRNAVLDVLTHTNARMKEIEEAVASLKALSGPPAEAVLQASQAQQSESRIVKLEETIEALALRLAVTATAHDESLVSVRHGHCDHRMQQLENRIAIVAAEHESNKGSVHKLLKDSDELAKTNERMTTLAKAVTKLIADSRTQESLVKGMHDATASVKALDRIEKLEGLVRALTLQNPSSISPTAGSPALKQRLPIQASNGQTIELNVPKGNALVPLKENRPPRRVTGTARPAAPPKAGNGAMKGSDAAGAVCSHAGEELVSVRSAEEDLVAASHAKCGSTDYIVD